MIKKYNYNIQKYNFSSVLETVFQVDQLAAINDDIDVFERSNDQSTKWHGLYYQWARTPEFTTLYDSFVAEFVKPLYGTSIVYQAIPTFRVAYPNNIAVGEWHKDKWYRDQQWAIEVREDNFYLPFTDAFDTNTIWVETEEDKGDFVPMDCKYGEFIQWDGSNLTHGNKINKTGRCRISVDFRVMSYENYKPSNHGSINTKTKFQIGDYYKLM